MKIVFMGTPDFAVPSLKALQQSEHTIAGVVTAPDRPMGRGRKMGAPVIKNLAVDYALPILQPEQLQDPGFISELRSWNADLFVVVAFRILPPAVFRLPAKGTFNLHASLLPKYRGAAPINWALINGEKESGVTTFYIDEKVDTGEILLQRSLPLTDDMTAGELHDALSIMGAELVLETIDGIAAGTLMPRRQSGDSTRAPKLTAELEQLSWSKSATACHNLIRGLSPAPGCYALFRGKRIKIMRSRVSGVMAPAALPGQIIAIGKNGPIDVQTGDGVLSLLQLKPEGRATMSAGEFSRGFHIALGDKFD
ncbi:methionyl-tRNA formyltransferase [candidate division KSB1 bacterium]|nr:methionyl-tRNA formyltransferase [candidate division KSB1 bacterium]RQW01612.1 MAG: methionyl-tRNA formyltransferase [candidate division KSB1 bacterium]